MQEGETTRMVNGGRQLKLKPSGTVRERSGMRGQKRNLRLHWSEFHPEISSAFQDLLAFCMCMR